MMAKETSQEPKDDEQQFSVRMPKDLHKALKVLCATEDGLSMNGVINEAVAQWIEAYKARQANDKKSPKPKGKAA